MCVPVHTAAPSMGASAGGSRRHELLTGLYAPPTARPDLSASLIAPPPHMSISDPVQTAPGLQRADGAPSTEIGAQVSPRGSYAAPLWSSIAPPCPMPPQTRSIFPVHTAAAETRPSGAPMLDIGVQVSVTGLYPAPSVRRPPP